MTLFTKTFKDLCSEEAGQAMTSNGMFLGLMALVAGGAYYYGGDSLRGFVTTVTTTLPPGKTGF